MTLPAQEARSRRTRFAARPDQQDSPPQTLGALPAEVNLVLYSGDDFFLDVTVSQAQGGGAADLTGAVVIAQIRANAIATDVLTSFDTTITGNVVHLHLPGTATEDLSGNGVWDCQITIGTVVTTLVRGTVNVTVDVSHA